MVGVLIFTSFASLHDFFQWNWLAAKQKFFLVNSLVTASVNIGPSRSTLEKCNICKSINVNESAILSAINLLKIWHAIQQPTSLISVGFHGLICGKIKNFNACFPTPETAPKTAYLSSSSNSGRQWTPPKELIVYRLFYFLRWNLNAVLQGFFILKLKTARKRGDFKSGGGISVKGLHFF